MVSKGIKTETVNNIKMSSSFPVAVVVFWRDFPCKPLNAVIPKGLV